MKIFSILLVSLAISMSLPGQNTSKTDNNFLTRKEVKQGWMLLFDGHSLNGWKGYNSELVFSCWSVANGELICKGEGGSETAGDIITDSEFGDFELSIDWKIANQGNSGIFYHVIEGAAYQAAYETGPEYQLIDDAGWPDKLAGWQTSGADYCMYPPNKNKILKPAGEWNHTCIIYNKHQVRYWLNGKKIVEFMAYSPDWQQKKSLSKWKDYPGYAISEKGKIGLQNHGSGVEFRNIKIRKLD